MNDEIESQLEELAEEQDLDFDELKDEFEENLEELREKMVVDIPQSDLLKSALTRIRADLQYERRTSVGPSGEVEEFDVVAIGNFGNMNWSDGDGGKKRVVVGVGIAAPKDTEEENRPAGVCVFICDETTGIDTGRVRELFQYGNHLKTWFVLEKLTEDFPDRKRQYYIAGSTEESKVEETDLSHKLPDNPNDLRKFLNENFIKEDFNLQNGAERLSRTDTEQFGANWADLRRFQGEVVDSFRRLPEDCEGDENPFGTMTLIDYTVASPEEVEDSPFYTDEDAENDRTPGLTVFLPPDMVCGRGSTLEIYGVLDKHPETGKIRMNAGGVSPLAPPEPYGSDDEGGDHEEAEVDSV